MRLLGDWDNSQRLGRPGLLLIRQRAEDMAKPGRGLLKRYALIVVLIWTAIVILSLGWNLYQLKQSIVRIARTSAEIS